MMGHSCVVAAAVLVSLTATARADVVNDWNATAIAVTASPPNSILQSRVLATVQAAVLDAATTAALQGQSTTAGERPQAGASLDAAVASSAHAVLVRLVPSQQTTLDATLAASLAQLPDGDAKNAGIEAGRAAASAWLARRADDGADAKVVYRPAPGMGQWQPTPPDSMAGILPHWGAVRPFVLKSAQQFEVGRPPAMGSERMARDLAEVREVGARNSRTRTADQTAAAVFWTIQTPVIWNAAARSAAQAHHLGPLETARVLALVNVACADSQIAGFEAKYRIAHWRPVTAIRQTADPSWEPLLVTPPHHEYPSAHALCSGAAEAVLTSYFRSDAVELTMTYPQGSGVTRSYGSFSQIANEVDNARVWGGIHFRSADEDDRNMGRRIGEYVWEWYRGDPTTFAAAHAGDR